MVPMEYGVWNAHWLKYIETSWTKTSNWTGNWSKSKSNEVLLKNIPIDDSAVTD